MVLSLSAFLPLTCLRWGWFGFRNMKSNRNLSKGDSWNENCWLTDWSIDRCMCLFILQPLKFEIKKKMKTRSERVKCIELHPELPWALVSLYSGNITIYDYSNEVINSIHLSLSMLMRIGSYSIRLNVFFSFPFWRPFSYLTSRPLWRHLRTRRRQCVLRNSLHASSWSSRAPTTYACVCTTTIPSKRLKLGRRIRITSGKYNWFLRIFQRKMLP